MSIKKSTVDWTLQLHFQIEMSLSELQLPAKWVHYRESQQIRTQVKKHYSRD